MNTYWIAFLGTLLYASSAFPQPPDTSKKMIPACLNELCFVDTLPRTRRFIDKFKLSSLQSESVCLSDGMVFLEVQTEHQDRSYINNLYLRTVPRCRENVIKTKTLAFMKTKEGLKLGQPMSEALRIYGEPSSVSFSDQTLPWKDGLVYYKNGTISEDGVLIYTTGEPDRLFKARIYIENDKIIGIELSDTE